MLLRLLGCLILSNKFLDDSRGKERLRRRRESRVTDLDSALPQAA